jgi:hypothetical protein
VVEWLTGFLFTWNYERKVEVLQKLHEMAKSGVGQDPQLGPVYQELVAHINVYRAQPLYLIPGGLTSEAIYKFTSGAFFWYLAGIGMYIFGRRQQLSNWKPAAIALLVVGTLFGLIGMLIPTFWHPILNVILYVIFGFLLLAWIYSAGTKIGNQSGT